jgi:hypothetical protein
MPLPGEHSTYPSGTDLPALVVQRYVTFGPQPTPSRCSYTHPIQAHYSTTFTNSIFRKWTQSTLTLSPGTGIPLRRLCLCGWSQNRTGSHKLHTAPSPPFVFRNCDTCWQARSFRWQAGNKRLQVLFCAGCTQSRQLICNQPEAVK